jgi:hypothetical protein
MGNTTYAATTTNAPINPFAQMVLNIAASLGFTASNQGTLTIGRYKFYPSHGGINVQFKNANGDLLTVDLCNNGANVETIQKMCVSSPNACGMVGTGFTTQVISRGETQIRNSVSPCSAKTPSDSLCTSTSIPIPASQQNSCVATNVCSGSDIVNSCTGSVIGSCPSGCKNGKCNPGCTAHYFCNNSDLYFGDNTYAYCSASKVQNCDWGCGGSACNPIAHAQFGAFTFTFTDGTTFSTDGALMARPRIVRNGLTSTLYWNALYVKAKSCKVVGTNGDSFLGIDSGTTPKTSSNSSGITGVKTSPILSKVVYTLTCTGIDGSMLATSTSVSIIPNFEEQ